MTWFTVAAAVATTVSAAAQQAGANKAASAAKKQGRIQAETERAVTQERIYQLGLEERTEMGRLQSAYVGSGVQVQPGTLGEGRITPATTEMTSRKYNPKGSKAEKQLINAGFTNRNTAVTSPTQITNPTSTPLLVMSEAAQAFARERRVTEQVGASNIAQIKQAAGATADRYRYQGYANLAGSIANIFKIGADAGW